MTAALIPIALLLASCALAAGTYLLGLRRGARAASGHAASVLSEVSGRAVAVGAVEDLRRVA